MQPQIVILTDGQEAPLKRSLDSVSGLDWPILLGAVGTELSSAHPSQSLIWRDSYADLWHQLLSTLPPSASVLVLHAGETLSGELAGLSEAAAPSLLRVTAAETIEFAPRWLKAGTRLEGRVYPTVAEATHVVENIEIKADDAFAPFAPATSGQWLERLETESRAGRDAAYALNALRFQQQRDAEALQGFVELAASGDDCWQQLARVMELKTRWELNQREAVLEKLDVYRQEQPEIEKIPGLWILRGVIARQLKEADLAMDCFQQATELAQRPEFARVNRVLASADISWKPLLGLAEVELTENLHVQAFLHFKQVDQLLPGNDYVLSQWLKASFFIHRYDTVREILASGQALRGLAADSRELLAALVAQPPDCARMRPVVERQALQPEPLRSDPFLVSVLLETAIALLRGRQLETATTALNLLNQILPGQPLIWHNLGYAAFSAGDFSLAEDYYRKALEIDSQFHDSRFDLAKVLVMQQRQEEALNELRHLQSLQPFDPKVTQAIRQLEVSDPAGFVPPLPTQRDPEADISPDAELGPNPFVFVFPLAGSWENGADIALKAFQQEFVPEECVILAFAEGIDPVLASESEAWTAARFTPEQLPPIVQLDEPMPLPDGQAAWVLPWRLPPGEGFLQAVADSARPYIVTDMHGFGDGPRLAALVHAETGEDRRRFWLEADVDAIAHQMRLAYAGLPANRTQGGTTHDLQGFGGHRPAAEMSYHPPAAEAPGISVCMIVRDEEAMLAECLASVQHQVAEIIVVDTGSQDRTREIAATCPKVRLFEYVWHDDFAAARNFALEQATQPWILSLDADEIVGPDFVASLQPYLAAGVQPDAYAFPIPAIEADGSLDEVHSLNCVPRLFPRRPDFRFRGRIHEMILRPGGPMRYVFLKQLPIQHRGYRQEVLRAKAKNQRDSALIERMLAEQPADAERLYLVLAGLYEAQDRSEDALTCIERGLGASEDPRLLQAMRQHRLQLLDRLGRDEVLLAVTETTADDPILLRFRAMALQRAGRQREAFAALESALEIAERHRLQPDPLEVSLTREVLFEDLARVAESLGEIATALYFYKRFVKADPSPAHVQLYEKLLKRAERK